MRWQLITALLRHAIVGGKCTIIGRCGSEANSLAEIIAAGTTMIAGIASAARLQNDAVAHGKALDTFSTLNDDSG
jgi:hypothetical protein